MLAPATQGILLRGYVERSAVKLGAFLRGRFDAGPITTVQRKGTSLFQSDFQALQPLVAASIMRELTAQRSRFTPALEAEIAKASWELEAERARPFIQPDLFPEKPTRSPQLNQRVPEMSAPAKPYTTSDLDSISHQIAVERAGAKSRSEVIFPLSISQAGSDAPPDFDAEEARGRHQMQTADAENTTSDERGVLRGARSYL